MFNKNKEEKLLNQPVLMPEPSPSRGIDSSTTVSRKKEMPKTEEFYWWQAPWGEVIRVTKSQQRELMRQWLESGK